MDGKTVITAVICTILCLPGRAQTAGSNEVMGFSRIGSDPVSAAMGFSGKAAPRRTAWASSSDIAAASFSQSAFDAAVSCQGWMPGEDLGHSKYAAGVSARAAGFTIAAALDRLKGNDSSMGERPSKLKLDAGLGYALLPWLSAGVSLRYLEQKDILGTDRAFSADVSAAASFSALTLAAGVSNMGAKVGRNYLPTSVFAAADLDFDVRSGRLRLDADADCFPASGSFAMAAGLEYSLRDRMFLRGGAHYGSKGCVLPTFVTAGAGIKLAGVRLDAAIILANEILGDSFTIGLAYGF